MDLTQRAKSKEEATLSAIDNLALIAKILRQEEVIKQNTFDDIIKCLKDIRSNKVEFADFLMDFWTNNPHQDIHQSYMRAVTTEPLESVVKAVNMWTLTLTKTS